LGNHGGEYVSISASAPHGVQSRLILSLGIRLPCGSLKQPHGAVVFHIKKFAKLLINLKIIKIIIIKNKKHKGWPACPKGWLEPPPWPIWGGWPPLMFSFVLIFFVFNYYYFYNF
jgi:hypothetical protein